MMASAAFLHGYEDLHEGASEHWSPQCRGRCGSELIQPRRLRPPASCAAIAAPSQSGKATATS